MLIGILAALACLLFYFLGFLFIQTIALVGYASIFPSILMWEKKKREGTIIDPSRLSEDDLWSKEKVKLEKLERQIEKENDPSAKRALVQEKRRLESKLRQLEWKIRELEMTQMYNASKGNMRQIKPPTSVFTTMATLDAGFKRQEARKNYLLKILKDVEETLKTEVPASREITLTRIANDIRAQHNILKRMIAKRSSPNGDSNSSSAVLSDYWVCWVAINSLAKGVAIEKNLLKYCSPDLQSQISKFIKFGDLNNLQVS